VSCIFQTPRRVKRHKARARPHVRLGARADFKAHRSCRGHRAALRDAVASDAARARETHATRETRETRAVNFSRAIADRRSRDRSRNARPRDASIASRSRRNASIPRDVAMPGARAPRAVHARQDAMMPFGDLVCVPVRTNEDVGGEERDARARGEALDHEVRCVI